MLESLKTPPQSSLTKMEKDLMNPGFVLYKRIYSEIKLMFDKNELTAEEYHKYVEFLDEKWKLMESPLHYAVYLVDPRFIDHKLSYREVQKGMDWLKERAGDDWTDFQHILKDMLHRRNIFEADAWKITVDEDPLKPFENLDICCDYEEYAQWATDIIQINGTSVALERSFKALRVVHNIWRRKLNADRLRKLVYIYVNVRAIEKYHGSLLIDANTDMSVFESL